MKTRSKSKKPTLVAEQTTSPATQEVPKWATEMPYEIHYNLEADDPNAMSSIIDQVRLTRDEYAALKLHLAKMRGYDVSEVEADAA